MYRVNSIKILSKLIQDNYKNMSKKDYDDNMVSGEYLEKNVKKNRTSRLDFVDIKEEFDVDIINIEKKIFTISKKNSENYNNLLQEVIEKILFSFKICKQISSKNLNIGWENNIYKNITLKMKEYEEYLLNPFSVSDGVIQCKKCKSYKTFSCQVQTRSSDESSTTIARCMICNKSWIYSG